MLQNLRNRAQDESGFTLIELLVVILIIGILAAIALPTFLGQQKKAQDSAAKADARNAVTQVESCFTDANSSPTYADCVDPIKYTGQPATVATAVAGANGFSAVGTSKSGTKFTITKADAGTYSRACDVPGKGGCKATADTDGNFW